MTIIDLDYKGPRKQQLRRQFQLDDLKKYLRSRGSKSELKDAQGKELEKDEKRALNQLRKQSFRFIKEDGKAKNMKASQIADVVEKMDQSEELEVKAPRGNQTLRMQQSRIAEDGGLPALRQPERRPRRLDHIDQSPRALDHTDQMERRPRRLDHGVTGFEPFAIQDAPNVPSNSFELDLH